MEPVLVIGGAGNLGYHIVKQLLESGISNITVFDININRNIVPGVKYIRGSISNAEDILSVLQTSKPRTIFHTASPSMLGQRNTRQVFKTANIDGTKHLLESIQKLGVTKALIYTSSSSIIHDNTTDLIRATEDTPYCLEPEQKIYYAHSKAIAEMMVLDANRKHGLLTVAIRACLLFGEKDNVMPTHIGYARSWRRRLQVGEGKNLCDWTYVGNCAHAHILAAKALLAIGPHTPPSPKDADKRVDGEAFVITNDEPWPFWKFPHTVAAVAGYPVKEEEVWVVPTWVFFCLAVVIEWAVWVVSLGRRESHLNRKMVRYFTMTRTFDIGKAKRRLGYRPLVGVEEGIRRAVESFLGGEGEGMEGRKGIRV